MLVDSMRRIRISKAKVLARTAALTITVLWLLVCATAILGQQPGGRPADTTNLERARQQAQSQREWQLRNPEMPVDARPDPRLRELAAEIEQDFQRILILNNQLAHFLLNNQPLNYEFVSDASAEIKKRASHLQKVLALNGPDEDPNKPKTKEFSDERIRDAVATLCSQIKNFVTNQVIDKPGTVNAAELARARHDLQDVIDVSSNLKRSADRLRKTSP